MVIFIKSNMTGPIYWAPLKKGTRGLLMIPGQNKIEKKLYEEFLKHNQDFKDRVNEGIFSLILPPKDDAELRIEKAKEKIKDANDRMANSSGIDERQAEIDKAQAEVDLEKAKEDLVKAQAEGGNPKACADLANFNVDKCKELISDVMDIRILEDWQKKDKRVGVIKAIEAQIEKITPKSKKDED